VCVTSARWQLRESVDAFTALARNRGLRRVELALVGSELGIWGYLVVISVIAFDAGGAAAVGLLSAVVALAQAVAAPFLSILGDHYDRRRVMIASDVARVVLLVGASALAVAEASATAQYVIAGVVYMISTAFRPAQAALLPSLTRTPEELAAANVVASTIESVGAFAGPAVAAILLAFTTPAVVFGVVAATYMWSALLLLGVPSRPIATRGGGQQRQEPFVEVLVAGAREIAGAPRVRVLVMMVGAQTLVAGALVVFVPVVALDVFGNDASVGALYSAFAVGGMIGAAVGVAALVGRRRLAPPFAVATILYGAPFAVLAFDVPFAIAAALLAVVGIANTIVDVCANTLLQRAVPDAVLARVFGILESIVFGTIALGSVVTALLIETFGLEIALVAVGCFLPIPVIALWTRLRGIDADAPPVVGEPVLTVGSGLPAAVAHPTTEQEP
jgi:MFS family permease